MRDAAKKSHSKGGFVMSAKQAVGLQHTGDKMLLRTATLYTTTRVLFMCAAAKTFAFWNPLIYFARQRITMANAAPTHASEWRIKNKNESSMRTWSKMHFLSCQWVLHSLYMQSQLKMRISSLVYIGKHRSSVNFSNCHWKLAGVFSMRIMREGGETSFNYHAQAENRKRECTT